MSQVMDTTQSRQHEKLAELKSRMDNPMPTAPVGTMVWWYRRADRSGDPIAALVTAIEEPSKLKITVFPANGMPEFNHQGVLHVSNPIHQKRGNDASNKCGAWDYIENALPPAKDLELHLSRLEKQAADMQMHIDQAEAALNPPVQEQPPQQPTQQPVTPESPKPTPKAPVVKKHPAKGKGKDLQTAK